MSTTTAATTETVVTIARADGSGNRQIYRNGVLVGECYKATASWCGVNGRRETWWVVTNVFGHCHREQTPTLSDVRAVFA